MFLRRGVVRRCGHRGTRGRAPSLPQRERVRLGDDSWPSRAVVKIRDDDALSLEANSAAAVVERFDGRAGRCF